MYASMMQGNGALMGTGQGASWITNSAVVHALASAPGGPYSATDIALGPRGKITRATTPAGCSDPAVAHPGGRVPAVVCSVVVCSVEANQFWDSATVHTPGAQRDPRTGMYLIWYMGIMQNTTNGDHGFPCLTNDVPPRPSAHAGSPECQQRVGLAMSADPAGPWLRWDAEGAHNNATEQSTFILPRARRFRLGVH